MKYAIVRTDLMVGTKEPSGLVNFKYFDGANTAPIENGNVVLLEGLMPGEREVRKAVKPTAKSSKRDIVLVAGVELMYDERKKDLSEHINEAGVITRGYRLVSTNIFSVTAEALTGEKPAVGSLVELANSTKMNVVSKATADTTLIGKVIAIETQGLDTYFVIEVA